MAQWSVTRWAGDTPPAWDELRRWLAREGITGESWSNGPRVLYAPHEHAYDKVIIVLTGEITFGLPSTGERVTLAVGDRLDLPAQTPHDATVGARGVTCLEAHHPATEAQMERPVKVDA